MELKSIYFVYQMTSAWKRYIFRRKKKDGLLFNAGRLRGRLHLCATGQQGLSVT